jgi:hypothetical protein
MRAARAVSWFCALIRCSGFCVGFYPRTTWSLEASVLRKFWAPEMGSAFALARRSLDRVVFASVKSKQLFGGFLG